MKVVELLAYYLCNIYLLHYHNTEKIIKTHSSWISTALISKALPIAPPPASPKYVFHILMLQV